MYDFYSVKLSIFIGAKYSQTALINIDTPIGVSVLFLELKAIPLVNY